MSVWGLNTRRGMTLVELLVVMLIISVLATLVVAVGPKLGEDQRASRGADQLSGWLLMARQRALRDKKPRGLRMIGDPKTGYVHSLQFIEQPEPVYGVIQNNVHPTTSVPYAQVIAGSYNGTNDYTGQVNQELTIGRD